MIVKASTSILVLKAALLESLSELLSALFPSRLIRRHGSEFRIGRNGSISVCGRRGFFYCHETGQSGDLLDLIAYALRTDIRGSIAWVKAWLGGSHAAMERLPTSRMPLRGDATRREKALSLGRRSKPLPGTQADQYLREHRGIALEQWPDDLRFLENCYNFTAQASYPALLAAIRNLAGEIIAVHCTFLNPITCDKISGDGIKAKLIFGGCKGGAVKFPGSHPERLVLAEGVEDALTLHQALPHPVWATLGTSGLRSVMLPDTAQDILIAADRDVAGLAAAQQAAERFTREGRTVRIITPRYGKDFNDEMMERQS